MSKWFFVPSGWQMSEDLLTWTKEKGLTDETIAEELESFRDHQFKRAMMKPDAWGPDRRCSGERISPARA